MATTTCPQWWPSRRWVIAGAMRLGPGNRAARSSLCGPPVGPAAAPTRLWLWAEARPSSLCCSLTRRWWGMRHAGRPAPRTPSTPSSASWAASEAVILKPPAALRCAQQQQRRRARMLMLAWPVRCCHWACCSQLACGPVPEAQHRAAACLYHRLDEVLGDTERLLYQVGEGDR